MKSYLRTSPANASVVKRTSRLRVARIGAIVAAAGLVFAGYLYHSSRMDSENDVTSSIRVGIGKTIPKGGGYYRIGDPYVIAGRTYTPREDPAYRAEGVASWYGEPFHGRLTANGEIFDMHALSAAHPTLPLPSYVRVTNLENNRSLIVRLNDRGPYRNNRLIDLSVKAAKLLGFYDQGLTQARVEFIGRAEIEGSDDNILAMTLRGDDPAATQLDANASSRPEIPNLAPAGRGSPLTSIQRTVALAKSRTSTDSARDIGEFAVGSDLIGKTYVEGRKATDDMFPKLIYD